MYHLHCVVILIQANNYASYNYYTTTAKAVISLQGTYSVYAVKFCGDLSPAFIKRDSRFCNYVEPSLINFPFHFALKLTHHV